MLVPGLRAGLGRRAGRGGAGVRVVVVGAGFAGLLAAYRVLQTGHQVVVLEARDRTGGRVWSQELVPGDRGPSRRGAGHPRAAAAGLRAGRRRPGAGQPWSAARTGPRRYDRAVVLAAARR